MITAISIENFKSVSSRIDIELKGMNLLFGPNGAGKSVIADALKFVRRCLLRDKLRDGESLTPEYFRACVHAHDDTRPIRLAVKIGFGKVFFGNFPSNPEEGSPDDFDELLGIIGDGDSATVELEVRLLDEQVRVTAVDVSIDDVRIARLESSKPKGPTTAKINFGHPILDTRMEFKKEPDWRADDEDWESPLYERNYALFGNAEPLALDLEDALPNSDFEIENKVKGRLYNVPNNALENFQGVARYLIDQPRYRLEMELQQIRFVAADRAGAGLRDVSRRSFGLDESCAALTADDELRKATSQFISEKKGIAVPVTIEQREGWQMNARRRLMSPPAWAQFDQAWVAEQRRKRVVFIDERNQTELGVDQLSLGTRSLVPVVVACLDKHNQETSPIPAGAVVVEEPESHLHPIAAAAIGDLFLDATLKPQQWGRKQIIAETHSEHLILRVLRRLREESGKPTPAFDEKELAIYYFSGGAHFGAPIRLEVNQRGEFLQPWPDDFFDQDDMERFS